jgi:ElaB/YqjD/DUF883 family membrane-anchored ribosome-binding protein
MQNSPLSDAQTPEALLNALRALLADAELMLGGDPDSDGAEAVTTLRARCAAAQERLSAICASAKKNIAAGARYTDRAIRANPYQALAIVLCAGLLTGALLGRRVK